MIFSKRIGIDLGTANVLVYVKGQGIVMDEPSVVAVSTRDGSIKAVGMAARDMLGRTPDTIEVVRPMKNGVIADYVITEQMLRYLLRKTAGRWSLGGPEVMICIPAGVTTVELRAVRDAALNGGAKHAWLIREPLAAAIGADVPVASPSGHLVVDIGGGTTEVAVIALNGIVVGRSLRVGGNKIDDEIGSYMKRKYGLMVGDRTAEELKITMGSAVHLNGNGSGGAPYSMEVAGRDVISGLPRTEVINSHEITDAIQEPMGMIVNAVKAVLEETPPELASDIIEKGMVLTGGGALLRNIDQLLAHRTGVQCYVAEDPLHCVAKGTGAALDRLDVLRDSLDE